MYRYCLVSLILLTLLACGHKAPLYLPAPEPVKNGQQPS
ncbi:MAG: lipoprotein [Nitrosomonas sp.]|nr:lipoprotein [Nitrosomonas sp.]